MSVVIENLSRLDEMLRICTETDVRAAAIRHHIAAGSLLPKLPRDVVNVLSGGAVPVSAMGVIAVIAAQVLDRRDYDRRLLVQLEKRLCARRVAS